jgi:hypothetical protein
VCIVGSLKYTLRLESIMTEYINCNNPFWPSGMYQDPEQELPQSSTISPSSDPDLEYDYRYQETKSRQHTDSNEIDFKLNPFILGNNFHCESFESNGLEDIIHNTIEKAVNEQEFQNILEEWIHLDSLIE